MIFFLKKYSGLLAPRKVQHFAKVFLPWILGISFLCLGIGAFWGLVLAPNDYQQGSFVKMMYIHVPSSWGALGVFSLMALFSVMALISRIPLYFYLTQAVAPIGALFCFLSLVTGSLWGKPTWGTWWVWDARLTSMLILFFLYLGYLNFVHHLDWQRGWMIATLIPILGWINIPIIKWSVDWWHTLHQPASLLRLAKPAIHPEFLGPLFMMTLGFTFYTIGLSLWRFSLILQQHRYNRG